MLDINTILKNIKEAKNIKELEKIFDTYLGKK